MAVQLGCRSIVQGLPSTCQTPGPIPCIKRMKRKMVVLKQSGFEMATVWPAWGSLLRSPPADSVTTGEGIQAIAGLASPHCHLTACLEGEGSVGS